MRKYYIVFIPLLLSIIFLGCTNNEALPHRLSKDQVIQKIQEQMNSKQNHIITYERTTHSRLANQKKAITQNQYQLNYKDKNSFTLSIRENLQSPTYKKPMSFQKTYQVQNEQVLEDNKPAKSKKLKEYLTKTYLEQQPAILPISRLPHLFNKWKAQITMQPNKNGYFLHYRTNEPEIIQQLLHLPADHNVGKHLQLNVTLSSTFQITSVKSESTYLSIEATQKHSVTRTDHWKIKAGQ